MTPEQLATIIELALMRVGDKLRNVSAQPNQAVDTSMLGNILREVADEIHGLVVKRARVSS